MNTHAAILAAFLLVMTAAAQEKIIETEDTIFVLPMNPPEVQTKAIQIMTAEERSEIIIQDIWKPPELERIKIGTGATLGKRVASDTPSYPYGWQAFVSQDARSSWIGGYEAVAYGEM